MTETSKPRAPFAPWDRRELPGLFPVEESARRVGNYKWAEMRLFEVLGGWVATIPELDVKLVLGRHTYHHAWHSELWHKRLPELREMNPDRLTVPPNDAFVTFMDAIREPVAVAWENWSRRYASHEEDASGVGAGPRRTVRAHEHRGSPLRPAGCEDGPARHRACAHGGRPTRRRRTFAFADARHLRG